MSFVHFVLKCIPTHSGIKNKYIKYNKNKGKRDKDKSVSCTVACV